VLEVDNSRVKMDFNHPLAGEELFFVGKVAHVRETVAEDFEHHHHACSCGGGCDC
jgi:FKBP-type peptidyl-prolyl cis-trans isomerase SlyD